MNPSRLLSVPFAFLAGALLLLLSGCAGTGAVGSGVSVTRDIIYTPPGWPAALPGDLYRPRTTQPAPAVLLVHGGGWTGNDRRREMRGIAMQLAERGYVVLNVTYRMAPQWQYPAPVDDLRQAIRWMRRNAATHGIDPTRIATFGYSAGGHLAALAGLMDGPADTRVQAIVAGGAPSDLTDGPLVRQFLGGGRSEVPQRFRQASPVNHVKRGSPPVFLYHGTADRTVGPEHARKFQAALRRANVPHEVYWIEGRGHVSAFLAPADSINRAIHFLDRTMRRR